MEDHHDLKAVATLFLKSKKTVAFTGAGVSVESGIPPFRGEGGIWNQYDPKILELDFFMQNPRQCWPLVKKLFYDFFDYKQPNAAHRILARWEKKQLLSTVITQNIDHLHHLAGSKNVIEFHGSAQRLVCLECGFLIDDIGRYLLKLPPSCPNCQSVLKPDFVFFGEGIPPEAYSKALEAVADAQLLLIIGTSGDVSPANQLPYIAKRNGATIVEINPEPSIYTNALTDFYLQGKAGEILSEIDRVIHPEQQLQ